MNEQRQQAYLNLIQRLLNCPTNDEFQETLAANQELVDVGFLQTIEAEAQRFSQQGDETTANWLQSLAMQLGEALNLDNKVDLQSLSEEEIQTYYQFLMEVLHATADSEGNPQVVYPLLAKNTDKLNGVLAEILRRWGTNILREAEADEAEYLAAVIVTFSTLIAQFLLSDKASNMEIAITGYEVVLKVYTREALPFEWARTQNLLGNAYRQRIKGDKEENIELVIAACSAALRVFTQQDFPQDWARTQNRLGLTYRQRILGEKAENIELAITAFYAALSVYTQQAFPLEWATTQNCLGVAYVDRIKGEKAENIELAITAFSAALNVYTQQAFPLEWAMTQGNLGNAYRERILGEKAENIELAIAACFAALSVYTHQAFPLEWATTQNCLGVAYVERILGEKAENIELAIAVYTAALRVYTQQAFPHDWAMTQGNLGAGYGQRILGEKAENMEQAIAAFTAALSVYTREALPQSWAMTQNNLGLAYSDRIKGDRADNIEIAIAAYKNALLVYTRSTFPQGYVETLFNLGIIYQKSQRLISAYITLQSAIETIEFLSREIIDRQQTKPELAEEWNKIYYSIIEVCVELKEYTEAIEYIELTKTRKLIKSLLPRIQSQIEAETIKLQKLERDNQQNISLKNLRQLRQQHEYLVSRIDRFNPIGLGEIQSILDNETVIIQFYILRNYFCAFIITRNNNEPAIWNSNEQDLDALINWNKEYLKDYYNPQDSNKIQWQNQLNTRLQKLAEILHIEEILAQRPKECQKLIFIPHLFLHMFPLHALPVKASYLIDLFPLGVSYAPSCQLLQQIQLRQRPDFQSLFAIQNPTEDLYFTDLEVESILSYFPSTSRQVLSKKKATKAALSQAATQLKQANYLHFSCHGYFNGNSPQNSFLLLADAHVSPIITNANPERYLQVSDTETIDLSKCLTLNNLFEQTFDLSQTRLVVLSACETGFIDFTNTSDEYIGLPSGFLYAGSSNVVSSLWTVNDLSTSFLMIKFIQILKDTTDMSVPLAINQSQLWLRDATKEELQEWVKKLNLDSTKKGKIRRQINKMTGDKPFNSPYHWAAFTAVGK